MSQKNTYKIGKIHQLFDLNNDAVNFVCNFRIMADNPQKHFEYLVISQSQLDNSDKLPEFNKAPGIGVGRVVADKGVHENYFLALRSKEQHSVTVETNFTKLPDDYHIAAQQQQQQSIEQQQSPLEQQQSPLAQQQQQSPLEQQQSPLAQQQQSPLEQQQLLEQNNHGDESQYDNQFVEHDHHDHHHDETFIQRMLKNKIIWILLTIGVLISVYFIFFSGSKNTNEKKSDKRKSSVSNSITADSVAPAVTTPAVTTPAVTTPAVTAPAVTAPAVTTPAVTTPAVTKTGGLNVEQLNKLSY